MRTETGSGPSLGLIHGAPLALKDLFETAGVRTTAGAIFLKENVPERDSTAYQKLRNAGAILLGKTNMHEIALGLTSVNPHYGTVRNPWNRERITGGSIWWFRRSAGSPVVRWIARNGYWRLYSRAGRAVRGCRAQTDERPS